MALSNAERQKRFREKLKAQARRTAEGTPMTEIPGREWKDFLAAIVRGAGVKLLEKHAGDGHYVLSQIGQASLDEFLAVEITALDQVEIMEEAGKERALKIFQRRCSEWALARLEATPAVLPV